MNAFTCENHLFYFADLATSISAKVQDEYPKCQQTDRCQSVMEVHSETVPDPDNSEHCEYYNMALYSGSLLCTGICVVLWSNDDM